MEYGIGFILGGLAWLIADFAWLYFAQSSRGRNVLFEELLKLRREKAILRETLAHIREGVRPFSDAEKGTGPAMAWDFVDECVTLALKETQGK